MGSLKTLLGRRRSENRIKRKSRAKGTTKSPDEQIDDILRPYVQRVEKAGTKLIKVTQARKAEGKQILTGWIKHGVGETYRGVVGRKSNQPKKRSRK